jgi:hypothetical protein
MLLNIPKDILFNHILARLHPGHSRVIAIVSKKARRLMWEYNRRPGKYPLGLPLAAWLRIFNYTSTLTNIHGVFPIMQKFARTWDNCIDIIRVDDNNISTVAEEIWNKYSIKGLDGL